MTRTSADALQSTRSAGGTAGSIRTRPRYGGRDVSLDELLLERPETHQHEDRRRDLEDRLHRLLDAAFHGQDALIQHDRRLRRLAQRLADEVRPGRRRRPRPGCVHDDRGPRDPQALSSSSAYESLTVRTRSARRAHRRSAHSSSSPARAAESGELPRTHEDVATVVDRPAAMAMAHPIERRERSRPHPVPDVGRFDDIVEGDRPAHRLQWELADPLPPVPAFDRPEHDRVAPARPHLRAVAVAPSVADAGSRRRRSRDRGPVPPPSASPKTRDEIAPLARRPGSAGSRPVARRERARDATVHRRSHPSRPRSRTRPSGRSAHRIRRSSRRGRRSAVERRAPAGARSPSGRSLQHGS